MHDPAGGHPLGITQTGTAGATTAALASRTPPADRRTGSGAIHTIERLIGVIPEAIWIALGALAVLALALGGSSWLAFGRARRSERQRRRLAVDVGLLQAALLPVIPERFGAAEVSVAYRPADGPAAGGDFYDVFELKDGRLALILGDVTGHGRAALPKTALIRYTLRTYLESGMRPRLALAAGAAALDRQLDGSLATVVLAVYDEHARVLSYACAGHPPPLVRPGSVDPVLECCSPPVGMEAPTGLRETTVLLPGRARVCFFTDGLIEARTGGELFGTERLTAVLDEAASADSLLKRVVAGSDTRADDMAACLLGLSGEELTPTLLSEELELRREPLDCAGTERFLRSYGVDSDRAQELLEEARATIAAFGAAVLRLRLDASAPHAQISPLSSSAEAPGGGLPGAGVELGLPT